MTKTNEKIDALIFALSFLFNGAIFLFILFFYKNDIIYNIYTASISVIAYLANSVFSAFILIYFLNSKNFVSDYAYTPIEKTIYLCVVLMAVTAGANMYLSEVKKMMPSSAGLSFILWVPVNYIATFSLYKVFKYNYLKHLILVLKTKKEKTNTKNIVALNPMKTE